MPRSPPNASIVLVEGLLRRKGERDVDPVRCPNKVGTNNERTFKAQTFRLTFFTFYATLNFVTFSFIVATCTSTVHT